MVFYYATNNYDDRFFQKLSLLRVLREWWKKIVEIHPRSWNLVVLKNADCISRCKLSPIKVIAIRDYFFLQSIILEIFRFDYTYD